MIRNNCEFRSVHMLFRDVIYSPNSIFIEDGFRQVEDHFARTTLTTTSVQIHPVSPVT